MFAYKDDALTEISKRLLNHSATIATTSGGVTNLFLIPLASKGIMLEVFLFRVIVMESACERLARVVR
jgi:hypothetical protein